MSAGIRTGIGRVIGAPVRARGFGLVELMLSLAIGTVLALAASSMLVGAHAAYLRHGAGARLDDSGRQALALMVRAVQQAGYAPADASAGAASVASAPAAGPIALMGLDAAGMARDRHGIDGPWPAAVNGSDVLAVRFSGAGDGGMTDCAGFAIADGEEGWSIFYVAAGADGEGELRCKYKGKDGWGADALVRGVDTLQILYGIDTDDPADGVPNRYLNATEVASLAGSDGWRRVASVRIALLLHGERGSDPAASPASHDLFGSGYAAIAGGRDAGVTIDERALPDGQRQRLRRVVGATVSVRNQGGA
jgi:type IV pilus assembly protein PilW